MRTKSFEDLVEALDRQDIGQHAIVADVAIARRLDTFPGVTMGPVVRTAVMACCLMPDVDVVHVHDDRGGQTGLLLAMTRSLPIVVTRDVSSMKKPGPLERAVLQRAQAIFDPQLLDVECLVEIYRNAARIKSELPENSDRR